MFNLPYVVTIDVCRDDGRQDLAVTASNLTEAGGKSNRLTDKDFSIHVDRDTVGVTRTVIPRLRHQRNDGLRSSGNLLGGRLLHLGRETLHRRRGRRHLQLRGLQRELVNAGRGVYRGGAHGRTAHVTLDHFGLGEGAGRGHTLNVGQGSVEVVKTHRGVIGTLEGPLPLATAQGVNSPDGLRANLADDGHTA